MQTIVPFHQPSLLSQLPSSLSRFEHHSTSSIDIDHDKKRVKSIEQDNTFATPCVGWSPNARFQQIEHLALYARGLQKFSEAKNKFEYLLASTTFLMLKRFWANTLSFSHHVRSNFIFVRVSVGVPNFSAIVFQPPSRNLYTEIDLCLLLHQGPRAGQQWRAGLSLTLNQSSQLAN